MENLTSTWRVAVVATVVLLASSAASLDSAGSSNPHPQPTASPVRQHLVAQTGRGDRQLTVSDAITSMQRAACGVQRQLQAGRRSRPAETKILASFSTDDATKEQLKARRRCEVVGLYNVGVTLRVTANGNIRVHDKLTLRQAMERVRQVGEKPRPFRVKLTLRSHQKSWEQAIRDWAVHIGVDPDLMACLARYESGFNPANSNGGCCHGLFQHHDCCWSGRTCTYYVCGASIFNGWAQIVVTGQMILRENWRGHWAAQQGRCF